MRWASSVVVAGMSAASLVAVSSGSAATSVASLAPAAAPAAKSGESKKAKGDEQITFFLGLKRDDAGAAKAVKAVSDPASARYRVFPSRQEIAEQYGASTKTIAAVKKVAAEYSLDVEIDGTGVFAAVTGPVKSWKKLLDVPVAKDKTVNAGQTQIAYSADLPANYAGPPELKGMATEFLPYWRSVTNSPLVSASAQITMTAPNNQHPDLNTGSGESCFADGPVGRQTYSWNQFLTAYGIDSLPEVSGENVRIVIMDEGDGYSDTTLAAAQECGDMNSVSFNATQVRGMTGTLNKSGGEGDLDVQAVAAVLPDGAEVSVLQSLGDLNLGFLDWAAAYNLPDLPDVLSSSYGSCEQELSGEQTAWRIGAVQEAIFTRLALAGTSTFSAAGDQGSSDCFPNTGEGSGDKQAAVDYPGSSPYVVSVGGTALSVDQANQRSAEVTWNNSTLPAPLSSGSGGSGGGVSMMFDRPWWQPGSMTKSSKRAVPDLAGPAAENPGVPLVLGNQMGAGTGGTSFAAPLLAAAFAVVAAGEREAGRPPLGLIQPWLYSGYGQDPGGFFDVVSTTNDVFNIGCCKARTGYDQASGLGTPMMDKIAAQLPPPGSGS